MSRATKFRPFQRACIVSQPSPTLPSPWPSLEEARLQLVRFSRDSAAAGLLVSTCGNASLRAGSDLMVLTGTGTELAHLTQHGIAEVELSQGLHRDGARPSSEWRVHLEAYRVRPEIGVILHCQSPAATLLACSQDPPRNLNLIPEVPAYVREHAYVPYLQPGGQELADAVAQALSSPGVNVVQLRNHGQLIVGRDPMTTLRRAIFFERACWLATQGRPLTYLSEEDCQAMWAYGDR